MLRQSPTGKVFKRRKRKGTKTALTLSRKSKLYRRYRENWKQYCNSETTNDAGNNSSDYHMTPVHAKNDPNSGALFPSNACPETAKEHTPSTSTLLASPDCSPIQKEGSMHQGMTPNNTRVNFSFLNNSANETGFSALCDDSGVSFATPVDEAFVLLRSILKAILQIFDDAGHLQAFTKLLEAIHSGAVAPDSLPLLLCFELAKFKTLTSTTCMTYSQVTLQFWSLLYRLLGGAVIRALSGPKNATQIVTQEATRGKYDPRKSKINFAVPSERVLSNLPGRFAGEVMPGIIKSTLDIIVQKAKEGLEFVLAYDSKSIGQGVTGERYGDIDMWGLESPNLERCLLQKKREINVMHSLAAHDVKDVKDFVCKLMHVWKIFSSRLRALRRNINEEHSNKLRLQKLIRNNPDMAKKYTYGLSKVNARIYLCQHAIKDVLKYINDVARCLAYCRENECNFVDSIVTLGQQLNCFLLLPPVLVATVIDIETHSQFIKQGTPEWHLIRSAARVTGSTAYSALGFRGISEQQQHYDYAINGLSKKVPDAEVQQRMEHGKAFEKHAVATLCSRIMPALLPHCHLFFETGPYTINSAMRPKLLEVSPDGLIQCTAGSNCSSKGEKNHYCSIALEIKCPYPKEDDYLCQPHYELPQCYVLQLLFEMKALQCDVLWYLSCTQRSTTLLEVHFDANLYNRILRMTEQLYGSDTAPYPEKVHPHLVLLKDDIKTFIRTHTKFMLEVPTVQAVEGNLLAGASPYCLLDSQVRNQVCPEYLSSLAKTLYAEGTQMVNRIHDLLRKPAQEVGLFMISDSDRISRDDDGNSWPLAYLLKGTKMDCEQLRILLGRCVDELRSHKVPVICQSVDGQWSQLVFKDHNGDPLTRLGLQKGTWAKVKNRSKRGCIKLLEKAAQPAIGDLHDLTLVERIPFKTHTFGNIELYTNATGVMCISSRGGILSDQGIIGTTSTLEGTNPHWLSNIPPTTTPIPVQKVRPVGLQQGESSLLNAVPPYIIRNILHEDVQDTYGFYCYAHLQTVLAHDSFKLLPDILTALTLRDESWAGYTQQELFPGLLRNAHLLHSKCIVEDLKVIASVLRKFTRRNWFSTEMVKVDMCNAIAAAFGSDELLHGPKNRKKKRLAKMQKECPSLAAIAQKVLMDDKYPVMCLRISIAKGLHVHRLKAWEKKSPVPLRYRMPMAGEELVCFSQPAWNEKWQKPDIVTMDVTHMLTNLRSNVLRGKGFTFASKESWRKVADHHPEIISRSIVYDNVDCQSAAFAKRVFSHAVENKMLENGDVADALFIRHVRNWYAACDRRGISCHYRMQALHEMHKLLTQGIDFNTFPPPGSYVHGIPHVTYQAMLQNIDSRIQIFGVSSKGSFNQRVVGTLQCESAFSDLVHFDKDALGAPKAINIPRLFSKMTHLNDFKHKPQK